MRCLARISCLFLNVLPALESAGDGHLVGVFQLSAEGQPPRQSGELDAQRLDDLGEVHGGGLAFHVGVGGQNDLGYLAALESFDKLGDTHIIRPHPVGG